jgi:hypothetical protein
MHRRDFSASRNAGLVAAVSDLAFIIPAAPDASLAHDVSPRIRKRGFLITRRFERNPQHHRRRAAEAYHQGHAEEVASSTTLQRVRIHPDEMPEANESSIGED